jgi:hypothetical protein
MSLVLLLLWVLLLLIQCLSQHLVRPVLKITVQNYRDFMEVILLYLNTLWNKFVCVCVWGGGDSSTFKCFIPKCLCTQHTQFQISTGNKEIDSTEEYHMVMLYVITSTPNFTTWVQESSQNLDTSTNIYGFIISYDGIICSSNLWTLCWQCFRHAINVQVWVPQLVSTSYISYCSAAVIIQPEIHNIWMPYISHTGRCNHQHFIHFLLLGGSYHSARNS